MKAVRMLAHVKLVCLCKHAWVHERLTTQPVDGALRSDALMLRARCPGDVEQRSQEVTGGCCVQDATYTKESVLLKAWWNTTSWHVLSHNQQLRGPIKQFMVLSHLPWQLYSADWAQRDTSPSLSPSSPLRPQPSPRWKRTAPRQCQGKRRWNYSSKANVSITVSNYVLLCCELWYVKCSKYLLDSQSKTSKSFFGS